MAELKDIVVVGLDLSLNAAGIVAIAAADGRVITRKYITQVKKFTTVYGNEKEWGIYLQPRTTKTKKREEEGKGQYVARRREFVSRSVIQSIPKSKFVLVCLEGYAIDSQSPGLLEMAEVSGIVRNHCWNHNIHLRVHDPKRVKLWACGQAYAKKMHMVNAARQAGFDIPQELLGLGNKFQYETVIDGHCHTHDYSGPGTDLADAYHLADMGRKELLVKRKMLRLDQLTEKQRSGVMLKITKANPVNLLSRSFVVNHSCCDLIGDGNGMDGVGSKESNQPR